MGYPKGRERKTNGTPLPPPANAESKDMQEEDEGQESKKQHGREKEKERVDVISPFFPTALPTWHTTSEKLNTNLYEAASPAKSLSSLAASDSGSDDEGQLNLDMDMDLTHGDGFNPPLASTQAPGKGPAKDGSFGWMGYNSQFDVDGTVDAVSKFMERDVSVGGDFDDDDGWMKELSP